jgi:hypothetical protein
MRMRGLVVIFNFKKSAATGTGAATLGFIRRRKADILG